MTRWWALNALAAGLVAVFVATRPAAVRSAPMTAITIDGRFDDWSGVPYYPDPHDLPDGSTLQDDLADVHTTNCTDTRFDKPLHVYHPPCDLLGMRITHDADGFYGYFRAAGDMRAQSLCTAHTTPNKCHGADRCGRTYIQMGFDMDNNVSTGYCLWQGGYNPSSCGWDVHRTCTHALPPLHPPLHRCWLDLTVHCVVRSFVRSFVLCSGD